MKHASRLRSGALLVAVTALLAGCHDESPGADATQVRRAVAAIEGIPQSGYTLGRPDAPSTLSVISAATSFELDQMITQLPALTERLVRAGRVKVQMRTPVAGAYGRGSGDPLVSAAPGCPTSIARWPSARALAFETHSPVPTRRPRPRVAAAVSCTC